MHLMLIKTSPQIMNIVVQCVTNFTTIFNCLDRDKLAGGIDHLGEVRSHFLAVRGMGKVGNKESLKP